MIKQCYATYQSFFFMSVEDQGIDHLIENIIITTTENLSIFKDNEMIMFPLYTEDI